MTTTTLSMGQLVALAKGAATKALHESCEVTCGVSMPEKDRADFIYRQILTTIFDAIGYKLPVDPEREAFDKWLTEAGWNGSDSLFEAWKAGRDDLRRCYQDNAESALDEIIPQTAKQPETIWTRHIPGDPRPCDAATLIDVLMNSEEDDGYIECLGQYIKHDSTWGEIIGWRYAAKQPENDGWIPWSGGECPVDVRAMVHVKTGDGWTTKEPLQAGRILWSSTPMQMPNAITAYKIIPQTTTK